MSKEVTYSRKATFTAKIVKGKRVFTAVNSRAKTVVKAVGNRKYITVTDLKTLVGRGTYTFHVYDANGELKRIRF